MKLNSAQSFIKRIEPNTRILLYRFLIDPYLIYKILNTKKKYKTKWLKSFYCLLCWIHNESWILKICVFFFISIILFLYLLYIYYFYVYPAVSDHGSSRKSQLILPILYIVLFIFCCNINCLVGEILRKKFVFRFIGENHYFFFSMRIWHKQHGESAISN